MIWQMSFVVVGLIFSSVGFAATTIVSADCTPLMVKTGLIASDELTIESATARYLQYLKHFLDQNHLSSSDLKVLLGFQRFPNLIAVFGEKISEDFIYRDDIEKLLPFLDKAQITKEIESLIKENLKEENKKIYFYDKAETVVGAFPAQREPLKSDADDKTFFISNDLGLMTVDWRDTLWHLETKKQFPASVRANNSGHSAQRISKKYAGQNYIAEVRRTTYHRPFEYLKEYTDSTIIVRNADNGVGLMGFRMETSHEAEQVELFWDHHGRLNIFWNIRDQKNKINALAYATSGKDITRIPIAEIPNSKVARPTKYITPDGRLYVLLERVFMNDTDPWSKSQYTVLDMSNKGKEIFSITLNKPDFYLFAFHKNPDGSFSLLGKNHKIGILSYSIRKNAFGIWQKCLIKFDDLESGHTIGEVVQFPNGDISYTLGSMSAENGEHWNGILEFTAKGIVPKTLHEIKSNIEKWYSYPEYSPFIVGHEIKQERSLFHLFNMKTHETHFIDVGLASDALKWSFEGVRFTPDGRIIAYYKRELSNTDPLDPQYQSVQLYGPMNPKTGKAVP
jgi:hypothetical protein